MADSLIASAQAEYEELKKALAEIEDRRGVLETRKRDLEEFFRIARTFDGQLLLGQMLADEPTKPKVSTKDAVIAGAEELLSGGKAMHSRQILAELQKMGVAVGGKSETNRVLHVSSILNKSGRFTADRARGWTLRAEQLEFPKGEARGARTPRASVAALSR